MKQRNQRSLAIFALAMALMATTIAYAALQTTLNISASVTRKGGSWDIAITEIGQYEYYNGSSSPQLGSTTYSELTPIGNGATASIEGTHATLNVTLSPNESKTFYIKVSNRGTIAANLRNFKLAFENGRQSVTTVGEVGYEGTCGGYTSWCNGTAINSDGHLRVTIKKMLPTYNFDGEETLVFTISYSDLGKTDLDFATDNLNIQIGYSQV